MRGYGPLAVFALMILLLSVLVPSKVPDTGADVGAGDLTAGGVTDGGFATTDGTVAADAGGATDGTAATGGTEGGATGGATTGGATTGGAAPPGSAGGCPDRKEQVPGDPYSPPCVAFSGSNGGGTHKGVTDKTIKVAFRVLNERGLPADPGRPGRRVARRTPPPP